MQTLTANQAKQSLGQLLDTVQREPVLIQKHNRPTAVVLSIRDYDRLRGLNVAEFSGFCDKIGQRANERGLTADTLKDILAEA